MRSNIVNFALFQIGWIATVFCAAQQWLHLAWLSAMFAVGLHLMMSTQYRQEIGLLVFAAALGFTVDSLNLQFGVFSAASTEVAPLWLVGLWMLFACTLNHSMQWMIKRPLLAAILSSLAGPLTYYAGARIGALTLSYSWSHLILSLQWALVMPLLIVISQKLPRINIGFLYSKLVK